MRRSQPTPEHAEAVSRRLATLSAELAAVRGDAPSTHTRVRGGVGPPGRPDHPDHPDHPDRPPGLRPDLPPDLPPEPVVVPAPGRHASRRLTDRFGPVHLAVVGVLVALALAVAAWTALGDRADPVPVPDVEAAPSGLAPAAAARSAAAPSAGATPPGPAIATGPAGAGGSAGAAEVTVDVAGRVRRPGIAVLPAGSRVVDALEAAGGARRGVDLTSLNLARPLVDGEQVLVGVPPPAGVAGTLGSPGEAVPTGALVNLNTADQAALESLPGVGPVTATAILDWRTEHGGFTAVDELLEVNGIGDATLADLAPLVTV
jgi:competence protein ComEA